MSNSYDPEQLARQISDGRPVDWSALSDSTHEKSALALLETIATTFRHHQHAPDAAGINTWGPLQLHEPLGHGGYGDVYRAFDPLLKRVVALKLQPLAQPQVRQWLEEARRLARVRHANVITVHGAEVHEGQAGIWCELIEGQSLQQRIEDQGPMGADEAVAIGQTLCAALAAVHRCGLVHGDVKPSNILREYGGRIVLVDFGSAREFAQGPAVSGSPGYLAPELMAGESPSAASDLYALAVTLQFLLTAKTPDSGAQDNLLDLRPDLPPALVHSLDRARSPVPGQRPSSAGALARELARSVSPVAPRSRRSLLITASAVALLAAVWTFWPRTPPPLLQEIEWVTRAPTGLTSPLSGPLKTGTALSLRLANSEPLYVYVINEDADGQRFVLYPVADPPAPLPAGSANLLPGQVNGQWLDWQVSSASAEERFAIFASPVRLNDLEQLLAQWNRPGAPGDNLRGVGEMTPVVLVEAPTLDSLVSLFDQRTNVQAVLISMAGEVLEQ